MNRNIITNDMQFNENKAIYIQIAERIADEIMLGVYNEDERIPSVRAYAARMEVNINTALRSYAYLEQTALFTNGAAWVTLSRPTPGNLSSGITKRISSEPSFRRCSTAWTCSA